MACTYRQILKVSPILGGFTTWNEDPVKSSFRKITYEEGYKIRICGDNVVMTSARGKVKSFHRALVVFRDPFNQSAGVSGCSQTMEFVENTPAVSVNKTDRISLSIGTVILSHKGRLVSRSVKLPSLSEVDKISPFLHAYILGYDTATYNEPTTPPTSFSCAQTVNMITSPVSSTKTQISLSFQMGSYRPGPGCDETFVAWYVASSQYPDTVFTPVYDDNVFNLSYSSGSSALFNIGYTVRDSHGVTFNLYDVFRFPSTQGSYSFTLGS